MLTLLNRFSLAFLATQIFFTTTYYLVYIIIGKEIKLSVGYYYF